MFYHTDNLSCQIRIKVIVSGLIVSIQSFAYVISEEMYIANHTVVYYNELG